MSAQHALAKTADWPAYEEEEDSTAFGSLQSLTEFGQGYRVGGVTITNPPQYRYTVGPTTVVFNGLFGDEVLPWTVRTTMPLSEVFGSAVTSIPPEWELLRAITAAPEDQRMECMRVLGLIEADEDDYVDPGPDPQSVDLDWLASIQSGRFPS